MSDELRLLEVGPKIKQVGRASGGYKARSVTPLGPDVDATIARVAQGSLNTTKLSG